MREDVVECLELVRRLTNRAAESSPRYVNLRAKRPERPARLPRRDERARARAGKGATLIECHTYRMWPQTTADDPTRYINPEEKAKWENRDPIDRMEKYLGAQGRWNASTAAQWESEINEEVEAAFSSASTYPRVEPREIYEHIFAEPTSTLTRQRRWHLGE